MRAEAAEVLAGLCYLRSFVVPAPRGVCERRGRQAADTERSCGENGVFLVAASGTRGDDGAESSMSRRQLLIVFILGGGCTVGTGTSYEFRRRVRHVIRSRKLEINAMGTLKSNADEALMQQSTEGGRPLSNGLGRWGEGAGR